VPNDGGGENAEAQVDASPVINTFEGLGEDMQGELPNEMAGAVADRLVREYISALKERERTGTGMANIESRQTGDGEYGITMPDYLEQVHSGATAAERKPVDEESYRLQVAAQEYGMSPTALAIVLRSEGVEASRWKDEPRKTVEKEVGKLVGEKLQQALRDNIER